MFDQEQYINIEKIDLDDQTYRISTEQNIDKLADSIQANGLITSVILRRINNKFIIISGYKRVLALKKIGFDKVLSKIIIDKETTEKTDFLCAKISIIENAFYRDLNVIEQAKSVSILIKLLSSEEISLNSSFFLNNTLNKKTIEKLLKIHELVLTNSSIENLLLSKKLSMNNALKINKYNTEIFDAFINIFNKTRMGQNKQSEVIVNSHEIAKREDIDLIKLLNSKKVLEIINHENPDENFKGNLLRSYLSKRRFPELTKAYHDHKNGIKQLKLEPLIKIEPPVNFEGEKYSVFFEFKDKKEFEKNVQKLVSTYKNETFKNLIK